MIVSAILNRPRAFTLAFILTSFFQAASVTNCNASTLSLAICFILSQTSTAMLFFFTSDRGLVPEQDCLWGVLYTLAGRPRSGYYGAAWTNIEVSVIVPLINDTAVFLAINYRILVHMGVTDSSMARLRGFFGGTGLSALSRALLQSGQHFYLIATTAHLTLLVVMKLPQLPPVYHTMLSVPGFALVNAMACLVFRRIKFGLISSDGTFKIPTIDLPSDFPTTANPRSLPDYFRRADATTLDPERNTIFPPEVRSGQKEIHGVEGVADTSQEISKTMKST
ncbi:hypothetical protein MSAN_02314500 [Mycena sanguinolenta]|uniref:Uncharacterized protein n=1 Tax=Mycena sanguinolenta TaxID=230812 RepID=A0A8H6X7S2_9AGAR|nr:hypothetical protein MSAN_02314500 [Mycena sanguinolenta]